MGRGLFVERFANATSVVSSEKRVGLKLLRGLTRVSKVCPSKDLSDVVDCCGLARFSLTYEHVWMWTNSRYFAFFFHCHNDTRTHNVTSILLRRGRQKLCYSVVFRGESLLSDITFRYTVCFLRILLQISIIKLYSILTDSDEINFTSDN